MSSDQHLDAQSQFDLDNVGKISRLPGNWDNDDPRFWPTEQEVDEAATLRSQQQRLANASLQSVVEVPVEEPHPEIDRFRLEQLAYQASVIFPQEFMSQKDRTPEKDQEIERNYRDGHGVPYSLAFELVMGIAEDYFRTLPEEPKYSFEGKSLRFIQIATKIFKTQNPNPAHKKELRDLIRELQPIVPEIEVARLKGEFQIDDNPDDLINFATKRLDYIKSQLPHLALGDQ